MIRDLLIDSWGFFCTHVLVMALIILPIVIPVEIFTLVYGATFIGVDSSYIERLVPALIGLLAFPLYSTATIFYIASVIEAKPIGIGTAWKLGMKFWVPCFVLTVLVLVLVMCGLALLVIPGLVLGLRYSFSQIDLLLNEHKPVESMMNSWKLTRGYMVQQGILLMR